MKDDDQERIKAYMAAKMKHIKMYNECMNLADGLDVEKFAELVRADEREACAKVCDEQSDRDGFEGGYANECAELIRARGEKPWVKTYCGGKPNYCTPVDAVNMTSDRVDKTAKSEHEPVYAFRRKGLDDFCTCDKRRYDELAGKPNLFEVAIFYTAPPVSDYHEGWEEGFKAAKRDSSSWVGLTDEEKEQATGWSVEHIEAKLKEKNT